MTNQIDPTKPPTHTTGSDHYRTAEKLLADSKARGLQSDYLTPEQGIAAAQVHALLAAAAPIEPLTIDEAAAEHFIAAYDREAPEPANQVAFARAVVDTILAARRVADDVRSPTGRVTADYVADTIDQLIDLLQNGALDRGRRRYLFKETEPGTFLPVDEAPAPTAKVDTTEAEAAAGSARLWLQQIDAGTLAPVKSRAIDLIRELVASIDELS